MDEYQENKNQKKQLNEDEKISKGFLAAITENDNLLDEETIKILKTVIGNKEKKGKPNDNSENKYES
jgi:hypothetical protein